MDRLPYKKARWIWENDAPQPDEYAEFAMDAEGHKAQHAHRSREEGISYVLPESHIETNIPIYLYLCLSRN